MAKHSAAWKALRASPQAEVRYVSDLKKILRGVHEYTEAALEPILAHWHPEDKTRADAKPSAAGVTSRVIAGLKVHVAKHVGEAFDRMADTVDKKNRAGMKVLGIDPLWTTPIQNVPAALAAMKEARERNIGYVEDAGRDYAEDVRDIFDDPDNFGLTVESLKKKLVDRGNVSESRAETIARTSTTNLNSSITQYRQKKAGITKYRWSTSRDERVRGDPSGKYPDADPSHFALEGQVFSWDDPPPADVDGGPANPGEAINCRCVPIPVFPGEEDDET